MIHSSQSSQSSQRRLSHPGFNNWHQLGIECQRNTSQSPSMPSRPYQSEKLLNFDYLFRFVSFLLLITDGLCAGLRHTVGDRLNRVIHVYLSLFLRPIGAHINRVNTRCYSGFEAWSARQWHRLHSRRCAQWVDTPTQFGPKDVNYMSVLNERPIDRLLLATALCPQTHRVVR